MVKFSRSWRLLQLLFPGAFEQGTPQAINPDVQPVWDAFRLAVGECFLNSAQASDVSAGVNIPQHALEPARGRIIVPVSLTAYHSGLAATERIDTVIQATANSPDPWGAFITAAPPAQRTVGVSITPIDGVHAGGKRLGLPPFVPRGNALFALWQAPTAGITCITDLLWLDCPGEIVSMLPFNHEGNS